MEWKDVIINGIISGYEVSTNGDIRNKDGKILSPYMINSGYLSIKITVRNIKYSFLMHRLIAETFILNPNNFPQVNHKDGNKLNNVVSNLEWVTRSENMYHASEQGLLHPKRGTDSPFAKHTEQQIIKACELLQNSKFSPTEISQLTGVSVLTINGILYRDKWKTITKNYDFSHRHGNKKKWSDEENEKIKDLHDKGYDYKSIAKEMNLDWDLCTTNHLYRYIKKCKTSTTS